MADNPLVEPDKFYGTGEVKESDEGQTESESVTSDEPIADESLNEAEDSEVEETEESEESEADDDADETEEELYLELDGEEVSLDEVKKWRDGHMMQADYTRKTMELADQRKKLEGVLSEAETYKQQASDALAELQAAIELDESVNLSEMRDYDPDGYIKHTESLAKRKELAEKYKQALTGSTVSQEELQSERQKLMKVFPSWYDDKGTPTKDMENAAKMLQEYWKSAGYSDSDVSRMVRARDIETSLKAAKYDALQKKTKEVVKKTKKAALVTKPTNKAKPQKPKSAADVFYGGKT